MSLTLNDGTNPSLSFTPLLHMEKSVYLICIPDNSSHSPRFVCELGTDALFHEIENILSLKETDCELKTDFLKHIRDSFCAQGHKTPYSIIILFPHERIKYEDEFSKKYIKFLGYKFSLSDFFFLISYLLSNTDLHENDYRINFVSKYDPEFSVKYNTYASNIVKNTDFGICARLYRGLKI